MGANRSRCLIANGIVGIVLRATPPRPPLNRTLGTGGNWSYLALGGVLYRARRPRNRHSPFQPFGRSAVEEAVPRAPSSSSSAFPAFLHSFVASENNPLSRGEKERHVVRLVSRRGNRSEITRSILFSPVYTCRSGSDFNAKPIDDTRGEGRGAEGGVV